MNPTIACGTANCNLNSWLRSVHLIHFNIRALASNEVPDLSSNACYPLPHQFIEILEQTEWMPLGAKQLFSFLKTPFPSFWDHTCQYVKLHLEETSTKVIALLACIVDVVNQGLVICLQLLGILVVILAILRKTNHSSRIIGAQKWGSELSERERGGLFALRFHCLTERNVGTFFHGVPLGCMSHDLMKHRPHFVTSGCISKLGQNPWKMIHFSRKSTKFWAPNETSFSQVPRRSGPSQRFGELKSYR